MGGAPFLKFVEVGRVVYLNEGPQEGKVAVIVDVIDGTRVLIDGPCSGVTRQEYKFAHIHLSKFTIKIRNSQHSPLVRKAWEKAEISQKWAASNWANNLHKRSLKANLTDFERFKLGKAKQTRNRIVNAAYFRLKKSAKNKKHAKKEAPKPKRAGQAAAGGKAKAPKAAKPVKAKVTK